MNIKEEEKVLLSALSSTLDDEELTFLTLQAIIAAEISTKRQELKLSQKEFAKKMGVTQSLVSRWENGDTNYTLQTLVRISSFLGLKMQSPIVPKHAKVYSIGNSSLYSFPGSDWSAQNTIVQTDDYNEFNNEELEEM